MSKLRDFANSILKKRGLKIVSMYYPPWDLSCLLGKGFYPRTIVDVGVADGTPELYQAFPDANFVLIEPVDEFEPIIRSTLEKYEGEYLKLALGEFSGKGVIHIDTSHLERSSFFKRRPPEISEHPVHPRPVEISTLDTLFKKHQWAAPYGLKIDAEGGELAIVRGAQEFLRQTQFVIAEVSVADRFSGGYSFKDFIELMDGYNFVLREILSDGRAGDNILTFLDCLFIKKERSN